MEKQNSRAKTRPEVPGKEKEEKIGI